MFGKRKNFFVFNVNKLSVFEASRIDNPSIKVAIKEYKSIKIE